MSKEFPTEREKADQLLKGNPTIDKLLTIGIYQHFKWSVIRSREATKGSFLSDQEHRAVCDEFNDDMWVKFENSAQEALVKFRGSETKWLAPIVQGVISAFIYSVLFVTALIIIKYNDIDILHSLGIEINQSKDASPRNIPTQSSPASKAPYSEDVKQK